MAAPMEIDHSYRLALTPKIDGQLAPEEWEPLGKLGGVYFQWEPGSLYWAAQAKQGDRVVLSLDWNGDGWLVGDDNLEISASNEGGELKVSVRQLDGDHPSGPTWVRPEVLEESLQLAKSEQPNGWTLEARYTPILGSEPSTDKRLGVRLDTVPESEDITAAYLPRTMAFVTLTMDIGEGVPPGLEVKPEFKVRSVPAGDRLKTSYFFESKTRLQFETLEFRCEGLGASSLASSSQPFPGFNGKNQARVPYESTVGPTAEPGYRILRTRLSDSLGRAAVIRSSFRITRLVDLDVNLPKTLELGPSPRPIKGSVTVLSQSLRRIDGTLSIEVPKGWSVTRGDGSRILIYHSRGTQRIGFELMPPPNASGVVPLTFRARIGEETAEKRVFLPTGA